ncbi:MAG: tetratricopeptide repeat protein [Pirellulales bacterium]|nr:tetratricopeptide repeat protein [Pirellulales bacterium]
MASAHANSSRLGPSDAELGMTPPAASNDNKPAETSAAENTPPSSLANQPLVRVRDPQRQDNAALKAMAERFNRREQATTKTPKTYEDWLNRGKSLAIEQKFKQAIAAYSKAIELDAYGLEAYGNRALAYREQKMYRESVYDFNIVLRLKPKMAKAYYDRAETYRVAGKLEKAARDYEEAIRLKPDFALAHAQYGTMLMLNGEYEDAVDILDAAIALDESDDLSVYDRGLAYALSGDFYSALQNFEQLSEPKMQDSKWESLLTRLRRSGEPITTVEMPPTGAQQNSEGQAPKSLIAKTTPGVIGDLANDPFFSGGRPRQETVAQNSAPKSGTPQSDQKVVDQTPPTESVAEAQPPTTSSQSTVPETTSSSDVAASPTLASPDNVAKNVADPERTLLQDPNRRSMDETANVTPQPTEPEKKPMRIVLGGGSTTLPRHKRTFVRVTEADPKPVESVVEKVEEDVTLPTKSHIVESPVQEPSTSTTGEVTAETDTDALWAATRRNRAVSRAALRGDGSLFQIITRDESSMNANEASDPFAVIATPSTRIGIGETIHSTEDDREESQDDAQMSVVKSSTDENAATDEVQSLEFDGVLLPDPKSVTTISEVDAAIAKYNDAILRRPRFAPYYVVRAQLWLKQERRTAALTDLRQAVRLDGDSAEAKSAMEKLEREIADDLARQQESLRTANRYGSGWGRRAPRQ